MSSKKLFLTGILAYVGILFLSLFFYKERCFFIDIAFHLFSIIQKNGLAIQNYRFGAAITQVVPLLAVRAGLSLQTITILYSTVFVAVYLTCYLVLGFIFKEYKMALVLLLINTLFVSDSFFWIQSELQQALAVFMLYWGYLRWLSTQQSNSYIHFIPMALLNILLAFFHPLLFFPYAFICCYFFADKKLFGNSALIISNFFFFVITVYAKKKLFSTEYDENAMKNSREFLIQQFPHYFNIYANFHFLSRSITWYILLTLAVILLCFLLGKQGKYVKLIFTLLFLGGYILFVNISFPTSDTPNFYIENMYLPVCIFVGIPLFFDCFSEVQERKIMSFMVLAIILVFPIRICFAAKPYSERLSWMRNYLNSHGHEKLIVSSKGLPKPLLIMTWGTPYEFWLMSTIETNKTASILITDNMDEQRWKASKTNVINFTWGCFNYAELPSRYFHFTDSSTAYRVIE